MIWFQVMKLEAVFILYLITLCVAIPEELALVGNNCCFLRAALCSVDSQLTPPTSHLMCLISRYMNLNWTQSLETII